MNLAIKKAKESGIGWVAAKNSNHFGICQWYTAMASRENLIGIASTNTSPLVAPTRSQNTVFGTNPIAVSTIYKSNLNKSKKKMSKCLRTYGPQIIRVPQLQIED